MDLSVVVVTYHSRDHILECLRSLEPGRGAPDDTRSRASRESVVVDNASTDGTPETVEKEAPYVRVVRTGANLGYAKAVNRGFAETTGRYVLVTNPDCVWPPGAVEALIAWLEAHPRCGIAAPRIRNTDGSLEYSARAYPDHFAFLFNRYSLLSRIFPRNPWTRRYLMLDWDHASARSVDWVSGAAMLVRRAAVAAVGGMDEAFFMFNEDVDWCRRMKLAGWSNAYVPDAVVMHHVGASKGRVAARVIVARHQGMIHYFHKHHPAHPLLEALAAGIIYLRAGLMLAQNAFKPRG